MTNELKQRAHALMKDKPIGAVKVAGRIARDDAGRLFEWKSLAQAEAQRKYAIRRGDSEPFFWSVMTNASYVSSVLSPTQRGYLFILAAYLAYDGRLINGNKPLTSAQMRDILGAKKSTFYDFIDACTAHGIMTEEDGSYRISEGFHYRGKKRDHDVTRSAMEQLREMADYLSAKDIGMLYSLIPLIHIDTNVVAENPWERDITKVVPMNRRKIAEAIGVDSSTFYRSISRMRFRDSSPMFARFETIDVKGMFVNPLLMARNVDAVDSSMRLVFGLRDGELK